MDDPARKLKAQIRNSIVVLLTILAIVGTVFCSSAVAVETPDDEPNLEPETASAEAGVIKFGLMSAAVAFGLGAIGAGFAISHVGAAAMGAVAEKPQIAGQALIFVALAEGIVVFGFITALMILGKV